MTEKKIEKHDTNRRTFLKGAGLSVSAGVASAAIGSHLPIDTAMADPVDFATVYSEENTSWLPPKPDLSIIAYNRMGFGPRPGDLEDFDSKGSDDASRLQAFIDEQLNPDAITDTEFETRKTAANFYTLGKTRTELWTEYRNAGSYGDRLIPLYELERLTFLRAIYSKKQFKELIYDFWINHFNVFGQDGNLGAMVVDLAENVIRPELFGNFKDMLQGTAKSTAMLIYLDNYISTAAGANENYARELFELHTMGAENYYGTIQQDQVPLDENGLPLGYVDIDVYESSRAFTGWSISYSTSKGDDNSGEFLYRNEDHDRHQKTVLGLLLQADQAAEKDGLDVIDRLANHPATARFICRKLCKRLISDDPPDEVVIGAADVFYNNRAAADQLTQVYRYILESDAFRNTWGEKVKRPFEVVASFFRATQFDFTFRMDHGATGNFFSYYNDTGQRLFGWSPPDGYPDFKQAWLSSAPRVYEWRLINYMVSRGTDDVDADVVTPDVADDYYLDCISQTPPDKRTAEEIADHWILRILGRTMDVIDRQEIIDYMGYGYNEEFDLPLDTDRDTQERLRMMVGLIACAPDFYWK